VAQLICSDHGVHFDVYLQTVQSRFLFQKKVCGRMLTWCHLTLTLWLMLQIYILLNDTIMSAFSERQHSKLSCVATDPPDVHQAVRDLGAPNFSAAD
jgi:hypothetical protein